MPTDICPTPPDLAEVVSAWPTLPEPIRAGILAMVRASHAPDSDPDAGLQSPKGTQGPRRSGRRRPREGGGN